MPHRNPISRFLLAVLLMLPLWFTLWYLFAPLLLAPVASLTDGILTGLWPDIFSEVAQHGRLFEVVTTFTPLLDRPVPVGLMAVFSFSLNPLSYGYSLPLLLAMSLAVPGRFQRPGYLLAALLLLFPAHAVAVGAAGMYASLQQLPPGYAHAVETTFGGQESVVVVYKMATLVLPGVLPVVLWGVLYADYLRFMGWREQVEPES